MESARDTASGGASTARIAVILSVALFLAGAAGTVLTTRAGLEVRAAYLAGCDGPSASAPSAECATMNTDLHTWQALGYLSVVATVVGLMSTIVQAFPGHPEFGWRNWYGARGKRWT